MRPHPSRTARALASGVAALVLAAGLAGCSGSAGSGGCTPAATAGRASDAVTASGAAGVAPTVRFPTPSHVTRTQVSRLRSGSGSTIIRTQRILADVTIVNATTGKTVVKTAYAGRSKAAAFAPDEVVLKGIGRGLQCGRVGDRLAIVVPPQDGYPAAQRPATVQPTDSLVVVADIRGAFLARADGADQVMAAGLPSVVLAPNGQPGITIPKGQRPPAKLQVANLEKGSGAVVKRGDDVVVQYTGVLWNEGTVFDSTWQKGPPVVLPLTTGQIGAKGLITALAGQRVGSQVLAVLPPSEGYGSAGSGAIPGNATLVFVIDVLGRS